jgi:hypothetical protein
MALLVLSLLLGTSAAQAANAYAGTYTMAYMDHLATGRAQYGTATVSTSGALTISLTTYVGTPLNQKQALTGTVSAAGVVTIKNSPAKVTIKFVKVGTTVSGFTGTIATTGGVMVAVRTK